jgi:hypothetical protein
LYVWYKGSVPPEMKNNEKLTNVRITKTWDNKTAFPLLQNVRKFMCVFQATENTIPKVKGLRIRVVSKELMIRVPTVEATSIPQSPSLFIFELSLEKTTLNGVKMTEVAIEFENQSHVEFVVCLKWDKLLSDWVTQGCTEKLKLGENQHEEIGNLMNKIKDLQKELQTSRDHQIALRSNSKPATE